MNFKEFDSDMELVIKRAFENQIGAIINIGSGFQDSAKAIDIAKKYSNIFAGIGLHPIHIKENFDQAAFEKIALNGKVVAIGETGLDYYYDKSTAESQKELFRKHLAIAQKVSKPVILHSRDAGEDVLSVLMEERNDLRGVMHCFQGNWQFAKIVLDLGFNISFNGLITFTKNQETFEVIEKIPLDRLMIETDCPLLTPEPYRGKRNEPLYVIEVAKKIAEIKKTDVEKVAELTSKNAIELFGLVLEKI